MMTASRFLPLTGPQYQIWLAELNCPDHALFTESALLHFSPDTSLDVLNQNLNRLVQDTDVLRIRLTLQDGSPVQYDAGYLPFACRRFPLSDSGKLTEIFDQDSRQPFSLYDSPLFRCKIYTLPEETAVLLQSHHLVTDGYGFAAICERFLSLCAGSEPRPLTPFLPLCEKEQPLSAQDQEQARAFWRDYLQGADFGLSPHPVPPVLDNRIGWASFPLPPALSDGLRSFLSREKVSAFCAFFAAFAVYLSRSLSSDDIVIMVPRLNRDSEESQHASGMFTAVVPVRVRVHDGVSFADLCRQVQVQSREAARRKNYPLSNIISDLQQEGSSGTQISYYTLSFLGEPPQPRGNALRIETHLGGAMTNLATLVVIGQPNGWSIQLDYRTSYYTDCEISSMASSLFLILEQGISSSLSCDRFEILPPAEKLRLRALLSGPEMPCAARETVVSLFRRQVSLHPDAPALSGKGASYTYRELDEASDRVARNLIAKGVAPEALVAFLLPRTTDLPVILLGILKAGAAFIPIDFSYSEGRVRYIIEKSGAALLISPENFQLSDTSCRHLCPEEVLAEPCEFQDLPEVLPEWLCYIIYTSGTTGRPKGVMIEHHSIANFVHPDGNPFNRDIVYNGTGIVCVGSICFDISMFEIFSTLLNGVPVVFADENGMNDPVALAEYLTESHANILHCTPSRLLAYLEEPKFRSAMHSVDIVLAAGEAFTQPLLSALRKATSARLYNGYGPTEATIGVTVGLVTDHITIGSTVNGAGLYLLDSKHRMIPQGATGELAISGEGLARGYLGLDELTAERFFLLRDGPCEERVYLTGDYGYALPDGQLVYQGRKDEQVKLRGLRIELQEIERCIETYPGIRQCAVLIREVSGHSHLCCYYSAQEPLDSSAMKQYAGNLLTRYMVPDFFLYLPVLPSTSNGKIDKKALAATDLEIEHFYVAPCNESERTLCHIFAEVLGIDEQTVSVTDSFFDLGGTSLLAARVVLLAKHAHIDLVYSDIFDDPTPRALAERLGNPVPAKTVSVLESSPSLICTPQEQELLRSVLRLNDHYRPGSHPLGTILLTGATGFLGSHILYELLKNPDNTIYCVIRPKNGISSQERLQGVLFYYFENHYGDLFQKRLFAVDGDLLQPEIAGLPEGVKIDTVINCAGDVSHFDVDGRIRETNVTSVRNLIGFCKKQDATLIHISTLSVGGFIPEDAADAGVCLNERRLWLRQDLSNVYLESKFTAEKMILLAIREQGLRAKIMRVGNLQGRISDGEFQMNKASNGFTKLLQSIVQTGKCPEFFANSQVNFSPVDASAQAICRMAGTSPIYSVFHIFNSQNLSATRLISHLRALGHPVEILDQPSFEQFMLDAAEDSSLQGALDGFLTRVVGEVNMVETPCESVFSVYALEQEGFLWPEISDEYLFSYLMGQETLGTFDFSTPSV